MFANAETTYVLFCAAAGRSALATKTAEMGFANIAHVDGGFGAPKAGLIALATKAGAGWGAD
ncbi:MAG: hypothetical protein R3D29_07350 [Nitratireductor sp.]